MKRAAESLPEAPKSFTFSSKHLLHQTLLEVFLELGFDGKQHFLEVLVAGFKSQKGDGGQNAGTSNETPNRQVL